jgi:rhomboid family GlyGly-CTERM serine protease
MYPFLTSIQFRAWLPWLLLLLTCSLLQIFGAYPALRLDLSLQDYAWLYTGLTCHLVHITDRHWLNNALATLILAYLFAPYYHWQNWLLTYFITAICISLGLLLYPTELHSYAGLSGMLHGLFVMGCLLLATRQPWLAILLGLLLVAKLLLQTLTGLSFTPHLQFTPALHAHVFGAVGGLLSGLVYFALLAARRRLRPDNQANKPTPIQN